MLVIRQEQIEAMTASDEAELESLVEAAVRSANPERLSDCDESVSRSMVRTAIARARLRGLSKAADIAAFAAVMFEIAPNFDEQAEIKAVLSDGTFPPAERFFQLFERVGPDAWADAERRYDELVWFPTRTVD